MRLATSVALVAMCALPSALRAQDTTHVKPDSTRPTEKAKPAPQPPPPTPLNFSGVLFGNYQYQGAKGATKDQNKFDLERAYLTFRMPAGERASIRATLDVFQQTNGSCATTTVATPSGGTTTVPCTAADAYYKGWVIRAKYAYLQYDYFKSADWLAVARIGMVHTMFIDHEENFWPRWLSQTPVERAGYFSSADLGVATVVTFPQKWGELYAAVTNGPGYTSRETDRFKDFQARLTVTPLSNAGPELSYLKTLAIDGWIYRGAQASKFVNGGAGQVSAVSQGLARNRYGVFAGIRDPRLTLGVDYAQRDDQGETGANTLAAPRAVVDSTGRLVAAYAVVKPFQIVNAKSDVPLGVVARVDHITPNTGKDPYYNIFIAGLTWDLSKKTAVSLDYQEQTPHGAGYVPTTKTYFIHWVANF